MNNVFIRSAALLISLILSLSLVLAGCVERPDGQNDGEWESAEEFTPSSGIGKDTEALYERYEEYEENASLAFKQNEVASESDFAVSNYESGVKIDKYVGSENIIVIPESIGGSAVLAVGEKAFSTTSIRAVYVPNSVIYIEKGAFEGASAVTTLRLPFVGDGKEITYFGHIFGSNGHSNHAVKVPTSLDMVILGEKTAEVAENAFAGCKSLSAIVLPESAVSVGNFAFYECRDLVYVNAEALQSVGEYAFGHCDSMPKISFERADSIGIGALYECNSLHSLTVRFVGENKSENRYIGYTFGAEVADHNAYFVPTSLYSVTVTGNDIPDRAFASCRYIGEVNLGDSVEKIGVRAFYSCRSLIEIALPDSVKTVGDDAFFGCDNLLLADLGSVESIGIQAFYGCRSLKSVEMPEKVTEIKPSTFALCSALTTVELNNIRMIGKDAFWRCDSLTPVDCAEIEVAVGNEALVLRAESAE